jgi:hypothetical protein
MVTSHRITVFIRACRCFLTNTPGESRLMTFLNCGDFLKKVKHANTRT